MSNEETFKQFDASVLGVDGQVEINNVPKPSPEALDAKYSMNSKNKSEKVHPSVPRIIEHRLAYQDAKLSSKEKEDALNWSMQSPGAKKYAYSILNLAQRDMTKLQKIHDELQQTMKTEALRLGVPLSVYADSTTWVAWDIGKQNHFFIHPQENNSVYTIADVFTSSEKQQEIVNRHLGWEAYNAFKNNMDWKNIVLRDARFRAVLPLLNSPPKQNGTLSSYKLAELGGALRKIN